MAGNRVTSKTLSGDERARLKDAMPKPTIRYTTNTLKHPNRTCYEVNGVTYVGIVNAGRAAGLVGARLNRLLGLLLGYSYAELFIRGSECASHEDCHHRRQEAQEIKDVFADDQSVQQER